MSEAAPPRALPYDLIGGGPGVAKLCQRFYAIMAEDEASAALRSMHNADLQPMIGRLAEFLNGWLGGPRDYFERDNAPCIMSLHKRLPIGAAERDQWMYCMRRALNDCGVTAEVQVMLEPAFARMAEAMRSQ